MVPYPEEIDVFSAPHSRMKALVDVYSEKLRCTDLSDCSALDSLLHELHSTFCEFKSHEQIENKYIMRKLKNRLKVLEMEDCAAVCNCHSDNQLSEMLALVEAGRCCSREEERRKFGRRLRRALHQFTTSFLPHMKEEEEVFQPMLMKYFEYEELKCLKEQVIEEHSKWSEKNALEEEAQADKKVDCSSIEWSRELPAEVLHHILSFLPIRDIVTCSSVSRQWHSASKDPSLWREIHPAFWAHGIWNDYCEESHEERVSLFYPGEGGQRWRDEDAEEENSPHQGEVLLFDGVARELLPQVGAGVHKVVISSSRALDSTTLRSILMLCPNLAHIDVSYTAILDAAFKGVRLLYLRHLNLSGCSRLTDEGLFRLADAMAPAEEEIEESGLKGRVCRQSEEVMCRISQCCHLVPSLQHLNLSGCKDITDQGFGCLLAAGVLRDLTFLDVSGCWLLSGDGLRSLPASLPPENISYCDRITDGPHPQQANGCQNLETTGRACCRNT